MQSRRGFAEDVSPLFAPCVAPTYAWLARKALLTRDHWKQVDETTFLFEKSGEPIQITDEMNLLHVTHLVVDVEYGYEVGTTRPPEWQKQELLLLAHYEVDQHMKPQ